MPLSLGTRLGGYEIASLLGAGGMGEVYRATDTKLGRDVAIKVLPEAFAEDPERLARFDQEARLLASLNHPHIAAIYGLEEAVPVDPSGGAPAGDRPAGARSSSEPAGPVRYLVLELVPGETLAERIGGRPLPVDEALQVCRQIAEALEAAHERGIIHRDLKPANVKVTPEGKVKVLDFGLAKAFQTDAAAGTDLSQSPTASFRGSREGVILGTAAYMSPEQARGKPLDKRTDIWSFGCVLYEVLTGKQAFRGETASDTISAILRGEPDCGVLPGTTPASVLRLIDRCLHKDAFNRLHDIADARIEIAEAIDEPAPASPLVPAALTRVARWRWLLTGALSGLVAGALFTTLILRHSSPRPNEETPGISRRLLIQLSDAAPLVLESAQPSSIPRRSLAISPDGSRLVYIAAIGDTQQLYLRRLDSFEITPIPGTEGAFHPFFSPDGEWVAFFSRDELKKVSLHGGEPVVLCEARVPLGGTWSDDGMIYFTHHENRLARVSADGGEPGDFTDAQVIYPHALPNRLGLLVPDFATVSSTRKDAAAIVHLSRDGESKKLIKGGYQARYVPSGHLVFLRGGGLFAAPFDLGRMELTGPPVSVLHGVRTDSIWGGAQYDFAEDGTLVYISGGDWARTVPTWVDRQGNEEPLPLQAQVYNTFELSPDQQRLAIQVTGAQDHIYVYDRARETFVRSTLQGGNFLPVWTKDGKHLVFCSNRDGLSRMYWKLVDRSGVAERLMTEAQAQRTEGQGHCPDSVSPDGKFLLFVSWGHPLRWADIWVLTLEGEREPRPLVSTEANEILASFSPDGRWIAFLSDKTGRYEVFVRPFPEVDRREWQVSNGGGDDPRWSPLGDELFYRDGARLMSVPFSTEPDFTPGSPRLLFEADFHNSAGRSFEVSADGKRFLVNKPVMSGEPAPPIHMVLNWFEELKRRVPTGNN